MHQVRMAYHLGEKNYGHVKFSQSLARLHNIIADDEISNRKYSAEDKIIVRNMTLNGRVIGGLVTEDHRKDWISMTIEEMYDNLADEIAKIQDELLAGRSMTDLAAEKADDFISKEILDTYIYVDIDSESDIEGITLKDFIKSGCRTEEGQWAKSYRDIAEVIYKELDGVTLNDTEVRKMLLKVAKSSPVEQIDLFNNGAVELHTPEEKYVAVEVLKKYKSEYAEWHDKVISALDELSDAEIRELMDLLK
jgi:hypothetical protein